MSGHDKNQKQRNVLHMPRSSISEMQMGHSLSGFKQSLAVEQALKRESLHDMMHVYMLGCMHACALQYVICVLGFVVMGFLANAVISRLQEKDS